MEKFLSLKEAAAQLGLKYSTFYRLVVNGEVPACRIGRTWEFIPSQLEEWQQKKFLEAVVKPIGRPKTTRADEILEQMGSRLIHRKRRKKEECD